MPELAESPEELKERIEALTRDLNQSRSDVDKLSKLDVLAFGGGEIDATELSDDDLREVFDMAMSSDKLNNLPDGFDPNKGRHDPLKQHPYSADALMESGVLTTDRSRTDMLKGLNALMEHNGHNLTMEVLAFKASATEMRIAALEGHLGTLQGDHQNLIKLGLAAEGDEMSQAIGLLKEGIKSFEQKIDMLSTEIEMQVEMYPDNILEQAKRLLDYPGLTPEELLTASQEEKALDAKLKKGEVGEEVFRRIEADKNLTHDQKQRIHQQLGKHGMEQELNQKQETTILRQATKNTHYMSAYLKVYAKEYNEALVQFAKDELDKTKLPNDPGLSKRFPRVGETDEQATGLKPGTQKQLNEMHEEFGGKLIRAHDEMLHKLSPEARAFLKSAMEPVQKLGRTEMTGLAMSSTLVLKNSNPMITDFAQKLRDRGGIEALKGNFLLESTKVLQTYTNSTDVEPGTKLGELKPQNKVAEKMLTAENLVRTREAYQVLAEGGERLEQLTAQLEVKEKIKPGLDKIAKLERQLDRMKEGGGWEKFKAARHGGAEKVKAKLIEEIDSAKLEVAKMVPLELFNKKPQKEEASVGKVEVVDDPKEKVEIGVKDVGEGVEVPTPNQTLPIKPKMTVDDLDQLIDELATEIKQDELAEGETVEPKKLIQGLDELDQLIQELEVEVETEKLDVDELGVSVQEVVEEIELTEEDMLVIDERLKELEMAIDQDSVDLKEMEELLLDLDVATLDSVVENVEVPSLEMDEEKIEMDTPVLDTQAKKVDVPKPDVSAFDAKIEKLRQEQQRLEKPTAGDRFKAFFKHGLKGVKGERDQLETKIEATTAAKDMVLSGVSTEVQRQKIEQLKQSIAETKHTLKEHRGILAVHAVANGFNTKSGFTREQLETAQTEGLKAEQKLDVLKAELKMEKKVLSVREKLGMKDLHAGEGVKAPTHGHGV